MQTQTIQETDFQIIMQFPKSNNDQSYLVIKNGRKLFFNKFIKKYGLDKIISNYKNSDINRRLRLIEFLNFSHKNVS